MEVCRSSISIYVRQIARRALSATINSEVIPVTSNASKMSMALTWWNNGETLARGYQLHDATKRSSSGSTRTIQRVAISWGDTTVILCTCCKCYSSDSVTVNLGSHKWKTREPVWLLHIYNRKSSTFRPSKSVLLEYVPDKYSSICGWNKARKSPCMFRGNQQNGARN